MSQSTGGWMNGVVPRGQPYTFNAAVTQIGTLMCKTTNAGEVGIASTSLRPIGYAGETTRGTAFGVDNLTVKHPVFPLVPGDKVGLPMIATNATINVGDLISISGTGGQVDKTTSGSFTIGVAEDSAAANDGATATPYIAVRVEFRKDGN